MTRTGSSPPSSTSGGTEHCPGGGLDDRVDLAARQGKSPPVGIAHQRGHLPPPGVREVADLLRAAESVGKPRGGPRAEPIENSLVQGLHGEVVHQRGGHDRLVVPLEVVGVLTDHGTGDSEPPVDGIAVHDRRVHVPNRLQRPAHDLLGLVDRDIVADLGAEEDLLEFIGDHPDGQRVGRERGRARPDVGSGREGFSPTKVERDGHRAVAFVVKVSPTHLILIFVRVAGVYLRGVRQRRANGFRVASPASLRRVVEDEVIRIDDRVLDLDVRRGIPPSA